MLNFNVSSFDYFFSMIRILTKANTEMKKIWNIKKDINAKKKKCS